jgi:hypothetical protein
MSWILNLNVISQITTNYIMCVPYVLSNMDSTLKLDLTLLWCMRGWVRIKVLIVLQCCICYYVSQSKSVGISAEWSTRPCCLSTSCIFWHYLLQGAHFCNEHSANSLASFIRDTHRLSHLKSQQRCIFYFIFLSRAFNKYCVLFFISICY